MIGVYPGDGGKEGGEGRVVGREVERFTNLIAHQEVGERAYIM